VAAVDYAGNVSAQSPPAQIIIAGTDTQPPSVPTNVQAVAESPTSIRVTWNASTDNVAVAGYKVYRNGSQVGTSTTTTYLDTGLSPSTTYSYTVSAYDGAGNNSAVSSPPAVASTPATDTQPPSVPTNVQAMALSSHSIRLTWSASTDNVGVRGYRIYRNGVEVATYEPPAASPGQLIGPFVAGTGSWNTLSNGGWELGDLSGWSYQYGTSYGTYAASQARAAVGDWSLKSSMAYAASAGLVLRQQNIPFTIGQTYVISGFFYTGDYTSGGTYLDLYDTDAWQGAYMGPSMGVNEWQFVWKAWTADRSKADIRILRHKPANTTDGGIYYDEIAITPASQFVPPTALIAYTDSGLASGTTYSYTVSAYDTSGNESAQSSPPAVATTEGGVDTEPPSVPTNVRATAQSGSQILVEWAASTDNVGVTGYRVFRNGAAVGTTAGTSYGDSGLRDATTYSYTVSAYDAAANESAQSSPPAVATTPDVTPPSVPTNVQATAQSSAWVQVTWTASTDNVGVTGYKIFRNGSQVGTSATTTYADTGLQSATTYSYTVSAYDAAANESAQSSPPAVAITPAVGGAGQRGVTGGFGLNNIGLLVRIWGRFIYVDASSFLVDDGGGTPVKCVVPEGVTLDPAWQYVGVTGISSCYKSGDDLMPLLRVRDASDIGAF